jgi:hypothetical protein
MHLTRRQLLIATTGGISGCASIDVLQPDGEIVKANNAALRYADQFSSHLRASGPTGFRSQGAFGSANDSPEPRPSPSVPAFPLPPPKPSAFMINLDEQLGKPTNDMISLGRLTKNALDSLGYETRFFVHGNGFAAVTLPERFMPNGSGLIGFERFTPSDNAIPWWDFSEVLRRLVLPARSLWRSFVFVVNDRPLAFSDAPVSLRSTLPSGLPQIPQQQRRQALRAPLFYSALVYELTPAAQVVGTINNETIFPPRLTAALHLEKTGILSKLKSARME